MNVWRPTPSFFLFISSAWLSHEGWLFAGREHLAGCFFAPLVHLFGVAISKSGSWEGCFTAIGVRGEGLHLSKCDHNLGYLFFRQAAQGM